MSIENSLEILMLTRNLAAAVARDGRPKYLIAAAAGLHPNVLGAAINGRAELTPIQRDRLAEALGVDVAEVVS